MVELPKTEEELQTLVNQKLEEQKTAFEKEKSELAYKLRKEGEDKLEKYKKDQTLTDEQRAEKLAQEKAQAVENELVSLRAFKKTTELKERLAKENLPSYFANDNRLINAEDGDLDKVIKVVKGEYEASLPKGNTHSTVVNTGGKPSNSGDTQEKGLESMAKAIEEMVS